MPEKGQLVITISGPPGSGKSFCAEQLAKLYGLRLVSSGGLFRAIAKERSCTLAELSKIAESDYSIDLEIDKRTKEEASKGGVVIEGRLSAWFAGPHASFKIYLTAPLTVRVQRIAERDGIPFQRALKETLDRELSERKRYLAIYGIDVDDFSVYDLVLNTAHFGKEEVIKILKSAIDSLLSSR
ncbi:MAG TPA: cytidylate kinase [Candidatus Methanomethylia archaeon]|nr:cytidylate kinase [Candidatus Methanomethylicia archaeon]